MNNPVVSIIVPVYNSEKYIQKCIDSILSQTFRDFELLLINDGSTDRSKEICSDNAKLDNRIRLFNKENGGVSSSRNKGIQESRGKYILFVDSDDFVESNYVEGFCFDLVEADLYMEGYVVDKLGKTEIHKLCDENEFYKGRDRLIQFYEKYEVRNFINSPISKLFRRDILINNKLGLDEKISLGEDHVFVLTYLGYIESVYVTSILAYHYVLFSTVGHLTSIVPSIDRVIYYYEKVREYMSVLLKKWGTDSFSIPYFYYRNQLLFCNTIRGNIRGKKIKEGIDCIHYLRKYAEKHEELFNHKIFCLSKENRFLIFVMKKDKIILSIFAIVWFKYIRVFFKRLFFRL